MKIIHVGLSVNRLHIYHEAAKMLYWLSSCWHMYCNKVIFLQLRTADYGRLLLKRRQKRKVYLKNNTMQNDATLHLQENCIIKHCFLKDR